MLLRNDPLMMFVFCSIYAARSQDLDWAKAIAINQTALIRIVAALIAMVGLGGDGMVARLRRPTYRAVLKVLRPAEAAVRRLIVIAARDLEAKLPPQRPFPKGL